VLKIDALQSLLVHVDASTHSAARLRAARRLAQQCDATLTALYAVKPAFIDLPLEVAAGAATVAMLQQLDDERRAQALALVEQVRAEPGPPLSWAQTEGEPLRGFVQRALYADLVVLGQHDPDNPASGVLPDFVQSVLISSGTPGLVLPYTDSAAAIGRRVLVAWKETPSSMRALRAALPLLRQAEQVHVASWGEVDQAAVGLLLQRHGVQPRMQCFAETDEVGALTLSLAADLSADLLVMGCYGHSRARELMLGGATRTILKSMTLPVLMAH